MVTIVVTACGRLGLLQRTLETFNNFNTYPVTEVIIVDDSGSPEIHRDIQNKFPDYTLVLEKKNRGQIACIDHAYSLVRTPYIFHTEDDWEFLRSGFIEQSMVILENYADVMQVWLRGVKDTNGHPIEEDVFNVDGVLFRNVTLVPPHDPAWHGFTLNPGLRRLSDYKRIAPFKGIGKDPRNHVNECEIGEVYYKLGYRAVTLLDQYCKHIGGADSVYTKQGFYK